jgi:uncharacterized protein (DUF4415 family)
MKRGFFSRFGRNDDEPEAMPASGMASETLEPASENLAEIVREIARRELPAPHRKAAISLRLDAEVLDWFRAQGPGYQTRINAILKAYKDAAG